MFLVTTEEDADFFGNDKLSLREAMHVADGNWDWMCGWSDEEQVLLIGCGFDESLCIISGCGPGYADSIYFADNVHEIHIVDNPFTYPKGLPSLEDNGTLIDGLTSNGKVVIDGTWRRETGWAIFDIYGANITIQNLAISTVCSQKSLPG